MIRRAIVVGLAMTAVGAVAALDVSPVIAAAPEGPVIGTFAMTSTVNSLTTDGDVGASGGLVTLDSGQASLVTRLDSTPSSNVLAQPIRPGSLFETLASQVPAGTPLPTSVPEAQASFPGQGHDSLQLIKPTKAGPFSVSGGSADATATKDSLSGDVVGQTSQLPGLFSSGASTSTISATASESSRILNEVARATVSHVVVGGVLDIGSVDAAASLSLKDGRYVETAVIRVGSATVAGQPVNIGSDGITAAGTSLPLGRSTATETRTLDTLLDKAGITVVALSATKHSGGRSSYADTGGVQITVKTPNLAAGIAGNTFTLTLGSIVLTEQDGPPLASGPPMPPGGDHSSKPTKPHHHASAPGTADSQPPSTSLGSTPSQSQPAASAPAGGHQGGAPAGSLSDEVLLAGHPLTHEELIAAFAGWQFLSLMIPTLYAMASSRRRAPQIRMPR